MKYILITLFLITGNLYAQKKLPDSLNTPIKRTKILTKQMYKRLNLNKVQLKKVDSLNYVYAVIMEKDVIRKGTSNWSKYWKTQSIMNEKEFFLRRILTSKQLKEYRKMRSEVMNRILRNNF